MISALPVHFVYLSRRSRESHTINKMTSPEQVEFIRKTIERMIRSPRFDIVQSGDEWNLMRSDYEIARTCRIEFENGDRELKIFDGVEGKRYGFQDWLRANKFQADRDDLGSILVHDALIESIRDLNERFKLCLTNGNGKRPADPVENGTGNKKRKTVDPPISTSLNSSGRSITVSGNAIPLPGYISGSGSGSASRSTPPLSNSGVDTSVALARKLDSESVENPHDDDDWEDDTPWKQVSVTCETAIESREVQRMREEERNLRTNMDILWKRLEQSEDVIHQLRKVRESMKSQMSFFYQYLANQQTKLQKSKADVEKLQNEKQALEIELKHAKEEIRSQSNQIQAYEIHCRSMGEIFAYCAHMTKEGITKSWPVSFPALENGMPK
jgi:hypothetical protein